MTRVTRRAALGGLALPLLRPGRAHADAPIPQVAAATIRDGWGVCGAPGIDAPVETYARLMRQLGTRDLRAHLVQGGRNGQDRFEALQHLRQGAGDPALRVTALVTAYLNDPGTDWAMQQAALLRFAGTGLLRAIEGPNELNNAEVGGGSHGPGGSSDQTGELRFPGNYRAWAEALGRFRAQAGAALQGVRVVAPSIASGRAWDYARLPDVSAFADAGNLHFYAGGGRQPSFSLRDNPVVGNFGNLLGWARAATHPGGPMWLTEAGASTSGNYAPSGVSQAKYLANQVLDLFAAGGERMFIYQLIDGSGRAGDVEGNFGLFRHDGTPKPAALMLARLQALLAGSGPGGPAPDLSAVRVPADAAPGRLLVRRPDGTALLCLWNEPVIDDGAGHVVDPAPVTVPVEFGATVSVAVHELVGGVASAVAFERGRDCSVTLTGSPVLLELRGA